MVPGPYWSAAPSGTSRATWRAIASVSTPAGAPVNSMWWTLDLVDDDDLLGRHRHAVGRVG